jgi:phenylacetaldehyde dehydrogenase
MTHTMDILLPGTEAPGLFIGGSYRPGSAGSYEVVNPSTEQVVALAPEASLEDARAAVAAARDTHTQWAATPVSERARLLEALADRLGSERVHLQALLAAEMGGTAIGSAGKTIDVAINAFRSSARLGVQGSEEAFTPRRGTAGRMLFGVVQRKPVGVVTVITAYNAPYVNVSTMAGPALVTGNTVVIKPAPQNPLGVLELGRLALEVGFPPGVINIVNARDPEIGRELVRHPQVDGVGFTGSPGVGIEIARAAAQQLKPVLLELGGKGACLVLEDADLDRAVEVLSLTWVFNSGQICGAPTRAIVHSSLKDELVRRLVAVAESLKIGPSDAADTVVGPVISAAHRDRIEGYVASAVTEGARVATGGDRPPIDRGFYAAPTLLTECTPEMTVIREEIFGPVIGLITVDSDEESITVANDSDYGLVDYVISQDHQRALTVAEQLICGNVNINGIQGGGNGIEDMPFGGRRLSGYGRKGGRYAIEAFTEPLGITINS